MRLFIAVLILVLMAGTAIAGGYHCPRVSYSVEATSQASVGSGGIVFNHGVTLGASTAQNNSAAYLGFSGTSVNTGANSQGSNSAMTMRFGPGLSSASSHQGGGAFAGGAINY